MSYYIEDHLFKTLKQLTLKCGRNISGYIYINHFENKDKMTNADFLNFRRDIQQEIQTNRTIRSGNLYDKYNKPAIDELKKILNICL
jgi:competence CoiA-like predicted nuclease